MSFCIRFGLDDPPESVVDLNHGIRAAHSFGGPHTRSGEMNTDKVVVRAGFAGALALAGGTGAYGSIVDATASLPADVVIPAGSNVSNLSAVWDINGDSLGDLQFRYRSNIAAAWPWTTRLFTSTGGAVVASGGGYGPYANLLTNSDIVGPASGFGAATNAVLGSVYGGTTYGGFGTVTGSIHGFVGFKFLDALSAVHYGWAEIEVFAEASGGAGAGTPGIRFFHAAYESSADTALPVGTLPTPGSIGALALGAATLLRRKQRVVA
jgi:hypothetical protein